MKTGSVRGVQHGPVPIVFRIHRLAVIGVHAVRGMAVGVRASQQGNGLLVQRGGAGSGLCQRHGMTRPHEQQHFVQGTVHIVVACRQGLGVVVLGAAQTV